MSARASSDGQLIHALGVNFYYDFISPYSYLAATQMPVLAREHAVPVRWIPVNLPKLIKLSENVPPGTIPKKAIYLVRDLKRWAQHLSVPFKLIKPGAFDSRPALWAATALTEDDGQAFAGAVFDALWSGQADPARGDWLASIVGMRGLPGEWLSFDESAARQALEQNTREALDAGAFGAPSFVLHGAAGRPRLFWGVDRLDFLARAIEQAREKSG